MAFVSKVWNQNVKRFVELAHPNVNRLLPIVERFTLVVEIGQIYQIFIFNFYESFWRVSEKFAGGGLSFLRRATEMFQWSLKPYQVFSGAFMRVPGDLGSFQYVLMHFWVSGVIRGIFSRERNSTLGSPGTLLEDSWNTMEPPLNPLTPLECLQKPLKALERSLNSLKPFGLPLECLCQRWEMYWKIQIN